MLSLVVVVGRGQWGIQPPSMCNDWAPMKDPAGLVRKAMAAATASA
ncbi:hypothetical protein ACFXKJ_28590 [Kitasatospora indigofera]